jgi:hypothetical protein
MRDSGTPRPPPPQGGSAQCRPVGAGVLDNQARQALARRVHDNWCYRALTLGRLDMLGLLPPYRRAGQPVPQARGGCVPVHVPICLVPRALFFSCALLPFDLVRCYCLPWGGSVVVCVGLWVFWCLPARLERQVDRGVSSVCLPRVDCMRLCASGADLVIYR